MPNRYKGKHQYKSRSKKLPDNKPGRILREFLDETPSTLYDGPIGNSEFVKSLGYTTHGSISSLANAWQNGKPIPTQTLYKIMKVYPEFPAEEYLKAYVEHNPSEDSIRDSFMLVLLLLERYQQKKAVLLDEFKFLPAQQPSSDNPLEILKDPMHAFENEWLADKSGHESPDPTRIERAEQKEKFRKAVSRNKMKPNTKEERL